MCTPVDLLSAKEASCDLAVASVLGESFVAAPRPADAVAWHESEDLALFEQQRAGALPDDARLAPTRRAVDHALVAGGEVEAWLSLCGDGQCDAPSDGESDDTDDGAAEPVDVCQEEESWGYGGEEGSCDVIETQRYIAVLAPSDAASCAAPGHHSMFHWSESTRPACCDLAICNVTKHDACTEYVGGLNFPQDYYSFLQGLGSTGSLIGVFVYGATMSKWTLRKTLVVVHIGLAAVGLADAALALRWNQDLGIDDRYFAGLDQFAYWFGFQCKLLPIYALATRICPPGVEATMIAMVLSLKNLGETLAQYYGAGLTTLAGIDYNECGAMPFDNLYLLYLWRIVCRLMPAAIILAIPTEAQIVHAMEALARHEKAVGGGADGALGQSLTEDGGVSTTENPTAGAEAPAPAEVLRSAND